MRKNTVLAYKVAFTVFVVVFILIVFFQQFYKSEENTIYDEKRMKNPLSGASIISSIFLQALIPALVSFMFIDGSIKATTLIVFVSSVIFIMLYQQYYNDREDTIMDEQFGKKPSSTVKTFSLIFAQAILVTILIVMAKIVYFPKKRKDKIYPGERVTSGGYPGLSLEDAAAERRALTKLGLSSLIDENDL